MHAPSEEQMNQFVAACRSVAAHGLVRCSSGNLSWRFDAEHMLVTASRTWMSTITPEGVAVCRVADGAVKGDAKPSVEVGFHLGVLRERSDVDVVLHYQSPCATTMACCPDYNPDFAVIPEIPYYIGTVARVPYAPPGTSDLAGAVVDALRGHDLVLLGNHGQVIVGKSFDDAIQKAAFFELACEIILRGGSRVRPIPQDAAEFLRREGGCC